MEVAHLEKRAKEATDTAGLTWRDGVDAGTQQRSQQLSACHLQYGNVGQCIRCGLQVRRVGGHHQPQNNWQQHLQVVAWWVRRERHRCFKRLAGHRVLVPGQELVQGGDVGTETSCRKATHCGRTDEELRLSTGDVQQAAQCIYAHRCVMDTCVDKSRVCRWNLRCAGGTWRVKKRMRQSHRQEKQGWMLEEKYEREEKEIQREREREREGGGGCRGRESN